MNLNGYSVLFLSRTDSMQMQYDSVKGLIYGFITATCGGIVLCLFKILLKITNITVFELIYQRSLISLVFVALILKFIKISFCSVEKDVFKYFQIRVISSFLGFVFQIFSLKFISVSKSVIIIYNPFITSIIAYILIGEKMTKHDIACFLVCTIGVVCLTNPFSESSYNINEILGISFALLASVSFNIGYSALRQIKNRQINSWVLVFFIMILNCLTMPAFFLTYQAYEEQVTYYNSQVWVIIFLTSVFTILTLYFTNLTFYYEKAGRGAAYYNFELIYTYFFDAIYLKHNFKFMELLGAFTIILANIYLYILKALGIIN